MQPLDNPAWHALTGPQATVAEGSGRARRYRAEYSVFSALPDDADPAAWNDLATLVGPDGHALLAARRGSARGLGTAAILPDPPDDPRPRRADRYGARSSQLGEADVDDLTTLIGIAQPGPWAERTHELGDFFGIRDTTNSSRPPVSACGSPTPWRSSAVAALPSARGRGYGAAVTRAAADAILRVRRATVPARACRQSRRDPDVRTGRVRDPAHHHRRPVSADTVWRRD